MERFMGRNKELVKYRDNHLILDCFTAFAMTGKDKMLCVIANGVKQSRVKRKK